jgi:hypothetical protein
MGAVITMAVSTGLGLGWATITVVLGFAQPPRT